MALHLNNADAERLARRLAALTGETVVDCVTRALRERLERVQPARRPSAAEITSGLSALVGEIRARFELTPITKAEWDTLWGEDELSAMILANRQP